MEFPVHQLYPWQYLVASSPALFSYQFIPENYVHWTQTPDSHIYSVDLPGVRKEEIKVEVENSRYLIIRSETVEESIRPAKSFMRKFRLPGNVDLAGITAEHEDGVLSVRVPRSCRRRGFLVDPEDVPQRLQVLARAA